MQAEETEAEAIETARGTLGSFTLLCCCTTFAALHPQLRYRALRPEAHGFTRSDTATSRSKAMPSKRELETDLTA